MRKTTLADKTGGSGATTMNGDHPTAVTTEIAITTRDGVMMEVREAENGDPTIAVIITPAE